MEVRTQGPQLADEKNVGFVEAKVVQRPEAQNGLELGFHSCFFLIEAIREALPAREATYKDLPDGGFMDVFSCRGFSIHSHGGP